MLLQEITTHLLLLPLVSCGASPCTPLQSGPAVLSTESSVAVQTAAAFDHEHRAWNAILQEHVQGDLFDYEALARDPAPLTKVIASLKAVEPEALQTWSEAQRYAFWINAYNAFTIQKVVENYPLESIRDLDKSFGLTSVFEQAWIPMQAHHPEGKDEKLSLNDIEHGILRARFKDARVHAAVNCASESCPPLLGEPFVAKRLDEQLESQMRAFVNDSRRNRHGRDKGILKLSEIFKWFEEDFTRDAGSVREYLIRYSAAEDAEFLRTAKIQYIDYSWDLNDLRERG